MGRSRSGCPAPFARGYRPFRVLVGAALRRLLRRAWLNPMSARSPDLAPSIVIPSGARDLLSAPIRCLVFAFERRLLSLCDSQFSGFTVATTPQTSLPSTTHTPIHPPLL